MQDAPQTLESRMVVIAASFKTIDWCFEVSRLIFGWRRFEWVQVCNPCRVKTLHIVVYSVTYNLTFCYSF